MTVNWVVRSGSRRLVVAGPPHMAVWWPALLAQIPAAYGGPVEVGNELAALTLTDGTTQADTRRIINARFHAEHLSNDTLSVHGVAVAKAGRAMLLIGDYGAGKSLTGLAMILSMGWSPVAGDTCLVRLNSRGLFDVVGGTRAYVLRRSAIEQWFPTLALGAADGDRVDLAESLPGSDSNTAPRLAGIMIVAVDGGGFASPPIPCGEQVAGNALYRASGHLLAKVLDDAAADPLSLLEGSELARRRLRLVRRLTSTVRCWWVRGEPGGMAAAVDAVTREEDQRWVS
ncbi:hypothetical protein O7632_04255 [Solwaraspora sp. WMMD406]|uniref:hypothetical protein n=1 Tax=Solwaraspora sp. WMMD406 TaxID=3016095 RepID=UPI002416D0D7|nr:hypothetical protein [Solwaraspora sp. WMMD406]MDG4763324.1 hypothetical protein [Solwaraspora sp. WMMD406]